MPNTMVNAASASATRSVPSCHQATAGAPSELRAGGEHVIARGHRLQLQRDVGDDADDGDQRDQRGQQRALAVAAGDEVGDRGDPVGLRDADHLAHHDPGQQHRQHRPEVDRQEPDPGGGRAPDAAEIGPGGAVDGQRQRVDPGVVDHRAAACRAPVGEGGDREQQQQVAEGNAEDERPGDHQSSDRMGRLAAGLRALLHAFNTYPMISITWTPFTRGHLVSPFSTAARLPRPAPRSAPPRSRRAPPATAAARAPWHPGPRRSASGS